MPLLLRLLRVLGEFRGPQPANVDGILLPKADQIWPWRPGATEDPETTMASRMGRWRGGIGHGGCKMRVPGIRQFFLVAIVANGTDPAAVSLSKLSLLYGGRVTWLSSGRQAYPAALVGSCKCVAVQGKRHNSSHPCWAVPDGLSGPSWVGDGYSSRWPSQPLATPIQVHSCPVS